MHSNNTVLSTLHLWQRIVSRSLKELPHDLSARQSAILLTVYMTPPPHTVRSLSEGLNISKPAVCRALDSLSINGLVKRKQDPKDKRNVLVQRTVNGSVFLSDYADIIMQESESIKDLELVNDAPQPYGQQEKLSA